MNCPRCGAQNQDVDSFCSYCGQDLRPAHGYLRPPAAPPVNPMPANPQAPSMYAPPSPCNPTVQTPLAPTASVAVAPAPPPEVPSYRGWASGLLACCWPAWPAAVAALTYAGRVESAREIGNLAAAREASRKALFWCWVTGAAGLALWVAILSLVSLHLG